MKLERVLTQGMSGHDVRFMQNKLRESGLYKGPSDGNFNQDTLVSIINFQNKIKLKANGIVSLQTWSRLINYNNNVQITKGIPYTISFSDETGFKIYDSKLDDSYYYSKTSEKNTIWLRSTKSNFLPDKQIGSWISKRKRDKKGKLTDEFIKSSTHYTIGGFDKNNVLWDGVIIRNFQDGFWSYHSPMLSEDINKSSISIEICNLGPLIKIDNNFYTESGLLVEEEQVVELDFNGYQYWNRYTESQIKSLKNLILYLKKKHKINNNSSYDLEWFEFDKKFKLGGLKTDSQSLVDKIGIFPQKEIIEMLNTI